MVHSLVARLWPLLLLVGSLGAVTLERLSLDEIIDSSTLIVRGTVGEAAPSRSGSLVQTEYRVQIAEVLKGNVSTRQVAVSVPGGSVEGLRQTLAGVPSLHAGEEYVFFLWQSRSGRLMLVGMTQGLFRVSHANGRSLATRAPVDGTMLDRRTGMAVRDAGLGMRLPSLREAVSRRVRESQGGRR